MKKTPYWLAGVLALGGLAAWLLRRQAPMLPVRAWQGPLEAAHGRSGARALLEAAEGRARRMLAEHPLPKERAMRSHLVEFILPGLAMYKTLIETHAGDRAAALAEMEPLFKAWTGDLYGGLMQAFRWLPARFFFFRKALVQRMKDFPASVWQTEWLENSPRRVAFNNRACYYLTTLAAYGAPELTPLYCQIDDWMGEMLPPQIRFTRAHTLARGGEVCDFCYVNLRPHSFFKTEIESIER